MTKRKPKTAAISLVSKLDQRLSIELMAPRAGDFPRPTTGLVMFDGKAIATVTGSLGPDFFEEQRGPGQPEKTNRDVAVQLAVWLGLAKLNELGELPDLREAKHYVMRLWGLMGFTGITEVRHVTKRIKKAAAALPSGGVIFTWTGFDRSRPGIVVLFDSKPQLDVRGDGTFASGRGWVWTEGEEAAQNRMIKSLKIPRNDPSTEAAMLAEFGN